MPREDKTTAAFGIYPKQRAKSSSPETVKEVNDLVKLLGDIILPKDAVDIGLMALPVAGPMRKLGAALIAGGASTDAEAGGLSALMRLLSKETPAQARQIREALGRAYTTNLEHSVVGSADKGPVGSIVSGTFDSVAPNQLDIARALKSDRAIADFHTHPVIGQTAFDISPSSTDFKFSSNEYFPGKQNRELRTIIASPADPSSRSPTAYSFFATDNPGKAFNSRNLKDAVFELQRAGSKGTFKSVLDDPRFREYFDYGGSMGELAENIAPLSLLDLRKSQGIGRGEVVLSGRPLSQNRESTNTELFRIMNPSAVELLTRKGFAKGGAVHMGIGGLLKLKNAVKGAQKVLPAAMDAGKVLSRAEADANKAKFMAESQDPRVMYHGTQADIKKFIPSKGAVFVSPDPKFASKHARQSFIIEDMDDVDSIMQTMSAAEQRKFNKYISSDEFNPEEVSTWLQSNMPKSYTNSNVMPLRVQIKNPFDYENPSHIEELKNLARKQFPEDVQVMSYIDQMKNYDHNWPFVENADIQRLIQQAGHDSFYSSEKGTKNLGIYNPNRIKSDIGNRGTYDVTDPDISKAKGGAVHMDEGGAAFGVFPQMKARRAQQDREAAANAPLSALRGWAAGTAGLPGDIEGLARAGISQLPPQLLTAFPALRAFGIGSRADPTPQMPTTEFYNEYLPGAQLNETPTGKLFTGAGNVLGGTGATSIARLGIKSAKATGQALGPTAVRIGEKYLERQGLMPGVIKMPGGNFLSGSVEKSVSPLKRRQTPSIATSQEEANDLIARGFVRDKSGGDGYYLPPDPINTFIDKKIAPYIRNEMATPGDPLRAMAEKYAVDKPAKLAEVQGRIDAFAAKMEQTARERGVPVGDLTSMRQQMIGLEKEKALIEARQALHTYNPEDALHGNWLPESVVSARKSAGFPEEGVGVSPVARAWENASDNFINVSPASRHISPLTPSEISRGLESTVDTNPWLLKVPPETPVYYPEGFGMSRNVNDLGFDHLVDELRNATNPESGLPKNLLIDPADLSKLTMPKAVELVADINAWRATQKIEADLLGANNAATFLHKDYPTIPGTDESNKLGLRWMQIRHDPSLDILPKSLKGKQEGDQYVIRNSKGEVMVRHDNYAYAFDDLKYNFPQYFKNDPLKKALKYEGDTMAHSVGGYATRGSYGAGGIDAIREGEASIYSLRDAKGQPRVTIETRPGYTIFDTGKPEGRPGPERIIQIKGFRNKKPADEFLPFVQDFVKSGKWSDVGDLQNTGLRRVTDAFNSNELKMIQGAGLEVPIWASGEDLQRLHNSITPEGQRLKYDSRGQVVGREEEYLDPTNYAQGGLVSNHFDPIKIKQIIAGLDDDYDPENIQQIIAQRESAYA